MIDLTTLSDEEIQSLQDQLDAERTRRVYLSRAPQQVAEIASQYVAAGGSITALTEALTQ